ncbi:hypothetical protein FVEN_g9352 [Fusarium venenatum]|uniref:Uncharacterized protein n=1 Tax=Fusarium venenatum TaxID=56646 RepID=A0A2L2T8K2_9HYPO|nr:uncharacterized protein FVRRES_05997 [Fusarium venenatum]KAG8352547.1 hypothetical protein FVEN_g9352 [Fusarium venenatum]CEI61561.1 unnamed protein product [Fusarium venenatum]
MANAPGIMQQLSQSTITAGQSSNQDPDVANSINTIVMRTISTSGIKHLEHQVWRLERKADRFLYKLAKERTERVAERAEHYKLVQTLARERAERAIERAESDILDQTLTKELAERAEEHDEREIESLG